MNNLYWLMKSSGANEVVFVLFTANNIVPLFLLQEGEEVISQTFCCPELARQAKSLFVCMCIVSFRPEANKQK